MYFWYKVLIDLALFVLVLHVPAYILVWTINKLFPRRNNAQVVSHRA